jgi:fibro-slime domain-containing protein
VKSHSLLVCAGFFSLVGFGCANGSTQQRPGEFDNGTGGTSDIIVTGGGEITTGGLGSGGTIGNVQVGGGDASSDCGSTLQVTFRDFTDKHPDFETVHPENTGFKGDVVRRQMVEAALGGDHKPVFKNGNGCPAPDPTTVKDLMTMKDKQVIADPLGCKDDNKDGMPDYIPAISEIQSAATFKSWYNTTDGTNVAIPKPLPLAETTPGSGMFFYDSAAFFPLMPTEGLGPSPMNSFNPNGKNFLFTTEIHVRFGYAAGQKFTFRGDDDLWIFVNGKLALDLGGLHNAIEVTIDFDAQAAALGISPGNTYPMDIFHAERHTDASNFRVSTNINCFEPVDIAK